MKKGKENKEVPDRKVSAIDQLLAGIRSGDVKVTHRQKPTKEQADYSRKRSILTSIFGNGSRERKNPRQP